MHQMILLLELSKQQTRKLLMALNGIYAIRFPVNPKLGQESKVFQQGNDQN